jgi:hypothetical protein
MRQCFGENLVQPIQIILSYHFEKRWTKKRTLDIRLPKEKTPENSDEYEKL